MEFLSDKAIYLQIADYVGDKILRKEWRAEDKIPSVRELSAMLEVNPNTVAKAYGELEIGGVIYSKRGIGFSVSENAERIIHSSRKKYFIDIELPILARKIKMLGIHWSELQNICEQ